MKMLSFVIALGMSAILALGAYAQSSTVETKQPKKYHSALAVKPKAPSIEVQLRDLKRDLQSQLDDLKAKLDAKDAQIIALQSAIKTTQDKTTAATAAVTTADSHADETAATVKGLQTFIDTLQATDTKVVAKVGEVQKSQEKIQKSLDEPVSLRYKGVTITPGGFVAAESIWRQRAMNADMYTNFNATPYLNSGEAYTSEWVPSARASRPSVFVSGKVPFGTLNSVFEADFLSAGTTSNNLQSNSYTLRVRQAWGQVIAGSFKFTGGQMWTLLTENKKATDAGQEALPLIFDGNLHVGDTYIRQTAFRFQYAFTPKVTLAAALENSQYQFSASNAPSNFFFGSAGAVGGLNNPTANYTNQVAPDGIIKLAFDPGYGHYEIGGVVRLFRDRYYPGTTAAGARNDTRVGGGLVANARFPVTKMVDVGLHVVAGDGTGRYGVSLLPDVTVRPNGTLAPIRNAQGLLSLEVHPTKKIDLFGYAGTEYAQRTYYVGTGGTLVGYAPPSANNSGCNTEGTPTSGTGFAPGVTSTCLGATRDIVQGSAGWAYRIYTGPAGKLQLGAAYSYVTREGWTGVGGAPMATNNFVYTSFRYFIP